MELKILHNFLTVAREENLSRAAELLHISQPALSRQMAALEDELHISLFERGRHLRLTEAGMQLQRRAEEICALVEKTEDEFRRQTQISGTISIGSSGLSGLRLMTPLMESFRQEYPDVQFELYSNSAQFIMERLEHGLLDFGLLLEPIDIAKFDFIRLPKPEIWGLLMHKDHPLANHAVITKDDFKDLKLMIPSRLDDQKEFESWLETPLSDLDVFATFNVVSNAATLAAQKAAAALTIEEAVSLYDPDQLVFRRLDPPLKKQSVLVWKKAAAASRAALKFLDVLKELH